MANRTEYPLVVFLQEVHKIPAQLMEELQEKGGAVGSIVQYAGDPSSPHHLLSLAFVGADGVVGGVNRKVLEVSRQQGGQLSFRDMLIVAEDALNSMLDEYIPSAGYDRGAAEQFVKQRLSDLLEEAFTCASPHASPIPVTQQAMDRLEELAAMGEEATRVPQVSGLELAGEVSADIQRVYKGLQGVADSPEAPEALIGFLIAPFFSGQLDGMFREGKCDEGLALAMQYRMLLRFRHHLGAKDRPIAWEDVQGLIGSAHLSISNELKHASLLEDNRYWEAIKDATFRIANDAREVLGMEPFKADRWTVEYARFLNQANEKPPLALVYSQDSTVEPVIPAVVADALEGKEKQEGFVEGLRRYSVALGERETRQEGAVRDAVLSDDAVRLAEQLPNYFAAQIDKAQGKALNDAWLAQTLEDFFDSRRGRLQHDLLDGKAFLVERALSSRVIELFKEARTEQKGVTGHVLG